MAAAAAVASFAGATVVAYDFGGYSNIGGSTHAFTGYFEYETGTPHSTVYYSGQNTPNQGFRTTYTGAVRALSIVLDNGESVSAGPGSIDFNNLQQSEPGASLPAGRSMQAYAGGAAGTINGNAITFLYLAFLPVEPNFNWDGLDAFFDGNAESILQSNPGALPPSIDPTLTGTQLTGDLITPFPDGLFLGTVHGVTTTVNTVNWFHLHTAPAPGALAIFGVGAAVRGPGGRRRGRGRNDG
ncbi:MAG: hypothetical protein U0625_04725 [Phycisphaerales bacterium]